MKFTVYDKRYTNTQPALGKRNIIIDEDGTRQVILGQYGGTNLYPYFVLCDQDYNIRFSRVHWGDWQISDKLCKEDFFKDMVKKALDVNVITKEEAETVKRAVRTTPVPNYSYAHGIF